LVQVVLVPLHLHGQVADTQLQVMEVIQRLLKVPQLLQQLVVAQVELMVRVQMVDLVVVVLDLMVLAVLLPKLIQVVAQVQDLPEAPEIQIAARIGAAVAVAVREQPALEQQVE
jgi:hypothetical protein